MAIFHCQIKVIGRSQGKSAVAAAAYRSCSKIVDERSGIVHDYSKKLSLGYSEILSPLPATGENAWLVDRDRLWNKVEGNEKRYDAQLAREVEVAIPAELDRQQQIELVREYVQATYVDRGMVADICFHDLGSHNPHAHIMLTMRELTIDVDGVASFGKKQRDWNDKKLVVEQRQAWEEIANEHLAQAGHEIEIDCRSLEDQGIDRLPQIHLGAKVNGLRKRGISTDRGDRYDLIDKINAIDRDKEHLAEGSKELDRQNEEFLTLIVNAERKGKESSESTRTEETSIAVPKSRGRSR